MILTHNSQQDSGRFVKCPLVDIGSRSYYPHTNDADKCHTVNSALTTRKGEPL